MPKDCKSPVEVIEMITRHSTGLGVVLVQCRWKELELVGTLEQKDIWPTLEREYFARQLRIFYTIYQI